MGSRDCEGILLEGPGEAPGDPGRACDERSGESPGEFRELVGGGFLWGPWVGKRDSVFFLNVSSKQQKSAHLPYQFKPQNETHFGGGVWVVLGASEGINSAAAVDPRAHSRAPTPQACAGRLAWCQK